MTKPPPACPICGRHPAQRYTPFCTARCQEVDLGRWLTGIYRIAGLPAETDEDPPPSPEAA